MRLVPSLAIAVLSFTSLTASAEMRRVRTLQYRHLGDVKVGDVLVAGKDGWQSLPATRLTVGSLISHPVKPLEVVKYAATRKQVRLTWREGGRLATHTFLPGDMLRSVPVDQMIRGHVTNVERFGTIRVTYKDQSAEQPQTLNEPATAQVLVDRTVHHWIKPKPRPAAPAGE